METLKSKHALLLAKREAEHRAGKSRPACARLSVANQCHLVNAPVLDCLALTRWAGAELEHLSATWKKRVLIAQQSVDNTMDKDTMAMLLARQAQVHVPPWQSKQPCLALTLPYPNLTLPVTQVLALAAKMKS